MLSVFFSNSVLIFVAIVLWITYYLVKSYSYWSDRGVVYLKPTPFLGNMGPTVLGRKFMGIQVADLHKELEGHKVGGIFQFTRPILLVRDPLVLREIMVKSFSSFHDRMDSMDDELNPLTASVFHVAGQRWRSMRYKLSPSFSTNKLKVFYNRLVICMKALDAKLQERIDLGDKDLEVKDLMSNYTLDAIAACVIGLECNTIRDGDSEFKRIALRFLTPDTMGQILNAIAFVFPKILQFFRVKITDTEVENFILSVTKDAVKMKSAENMKSEKDFLQYVVDLRRKEEACLRGEAKVGEMKEMEVKGNNTKELENDDGLLFTDNVIAANTAVYLVAGFDTTANSLSFTLYELARNPAVQQRLHEEIKTHWSFPNLDIPFETLKKLTYADCVINESLRKYPLAGTIFRICTEECQIPEINFTVEKGLMVFASVQALHYDPTYFPDPEKFDPDRFSEENKDKIFPGSYLPFGDGPRTCIAKRFALLVIKTMLVNMIAKYSIHLSEKTPQKIEYHKKAFNLTAEGGITLHFENRRGKNL